MRMYPSVEQAGTMQNAISWRVGAVAEIRQPCTVKVRVGEVAGFSVLLPR